MTTSSAATQWQKFRQNGNTSVSVKCQNQSDPVLSHYGDVIMGTMASQITSITIVYSTVYSGADQRKHQSSASLAFVRGIHRGPVNSPHKWPVTWKMFPFDDVMKIRRILFRFWHIKARLLGCSQRINKQMLKIKKKGSQHDADVRSSTWWFRITWPELSRHQAISNHHKDLTPTIAPGINHYGPKICCISH